MLGICKRFYAFEEAQDLFNSISGYSIQACGNGRSSVWFCWLGLGIDYCWGQVWVGLVGVWVGQNEDCSPVRAESFPWVSAPNRSGRLTLLTGGSNQSIAALIQLDLHQHTHRNTYWELLFHEKRYQPYSQTLQTRQLKLFESCCNDHSFEMSAHEWHYNAITSWKL